MANFSRPITFNYTGFTNCSCCSWTMPPLTSLDFSTNCTLVAEWARTWESGGGGVNDWVVVKYFRQALPPTLGKNLTSGQVLDWYRRLLIEVKRYSENGSDPSESPWRKKVTRGAFDVCVDEVCKKLEWKGVPDILGPGVMISTWIQAVLATLLVLLMLWEWHHQRKGVVPGLKRQRLFDAATTSLGLFEDTGFLLSIIISVAVIVFLSCPEMVKGSTQAALALEMAVFAVYAVLFPGQVDEFLREWSGRTANTGPRHWGTTYLMAILFVVAVNMASVKFLDVDARSWEVSCTSDIAPRERTTSRAFLLSGGCALGTWILVPIVGKLWKKWSVGARVLQKVRRATGPAFAVVAGLMMWYMVINITVVRQILLARSGYRSEDMEWSFGQILALGAWVPFTLDVISMICVGIKRSLDQKMPTGWVVVTSEQASSSNAQETTAHQNVTIAQRRSCLAQVERTMSSTKYREAILRSRVVHGQTRLTSEARIGIRALGSSCFSHVESS